MPAGGGPVVRVLRARPLPFPLSRMTVTALATARCAAASKCPPPAWAPHGRSRGGRGRGRDPRGAACGPPVDAAGMILAEAHLRTKGIGAGSLDTAIASASAALLGLGDGAGDGFVDASLGAGFDPRAIRSRGRTGDAARLAAAGGPSEPPRLMEAEVAGAREARRLRMRSHPAPREARRLSGTGDGAREDLVAYVGPAPKAAPPPAREAAGAASTVTLQDGEVVPAAADTLAQVRRTLRGLRASEGARERVDDPGHDHAATPQAPAALRRRQRAQRRAAMAHGTRHHPCPLQGGCGTGHGAACPLESHPAVSCVQWLRTGRCSAASEGRCPWHHGTSRDGGGAGAAVTVVLAESLIAGDMVEPAAAAQVGVRLRAGVPAVGSMLQFFVDAVSAAREGAAASVPEPPPGTEADLAEVLRVTDGAAAGLVWWSAERQVVCADFSLALVAAQDAADSGGGVLDAARELEALWAEAEREEQREGPQAVEDDGEVSLPEENGGVVDPLDSELARDVRALWASYFVWEPTEAGSGLAAAGAPLGLSPLLTDWLLARAAEQSQQQSLEHDEPMYTARELFWSATRHLLRRRLAECAEFLTASAEGAAVLPGSAVGRLQWAPLLLLRDLVLVQQLTSGAAAAVAAAGADAPLTNSFLDTPAAAPRVAAQPASTDPLLELLRAAHAEDEACAPRGRTTATPPPRTHVRTEVDTVWSAVHGTLGTLWAGLLRAEELLAFPPTLQSAPTEAGPARLGEQLVSDMRAQVRRRQDRGGGPLALSALVQSSFLGLVRGASQAVGSTYEDALLESVGARPWTDAQMFGEFHSAAYAAAAYARHHQPVLAAACEASLLNALLALTTTHLLREHGMSERAPGQALLSVPALRGEVGVARWVRRHGPAQSSHRARAAALRVGTAVPLAFLSALQELAATVTARQAALRQTYAARHAAFAAAEEERRRGQRTRKYHSSSSSRGGESLRGEQSLTGPTAVVPPAPLDELLPHGTVAVSAAATADLLRLLLEGGAAYRAMRLAVSIARATRALRQAALSPPPTLAVTHRTVHRMHRSARTAQKHVVKVRVPVLRVVRSSDHGLVRETGAGQGGEGGGPQPASPVSLLYRVDACVVEEVLRLGLRVGAAGVRLADGVVADCIRGHVTDLGTARCLPAPPSLDAAMHRGGGERSPWAREASPAATVLALRGAGGDGPPSEGLQAVYRVPPTPLLVELLAAEAAPTDAARQQRGHRLLALDPSRFGTTGVVLARQCALAAAHPAWALQAKECVWVRTLDTSGVGGGGRVDVRALAAAVRGHRALVDTWAAPPTLSPGAHPAVSASAAAGGGARGAAQENAAPRTTEQLKALLRRQDGGVDALAAETETETAQGPAASAGARASRRARAALRHPLLHSRAETLLVHLWEQRGPGGGGRSRRELLWASCAGALLGMPADVLGGTQTTGRLAATTLAQAAVTAVELDGEAGEGVWVERTLAALSVAPLWGAGERSVGCDGREGGGPPPLSLSSARAVVVADVGALLALQGKLLHTVMGAEIPEGSRPVPRELLEWAASTGSHRSQAEHAAWLLLEPLPAHSPWVAWEWLSVTCVRPSTRLLAWLVAHVDRRDQEGLAAMLAWLDTIASAGHAPASSFVPAVAELLRRAQHRPAKAKTP